MRIWITCLLAVAALLLGAGSASAWAFDASVRGGVAPLYNLGDTVTVDIFMDAEIGLTVLSLGVIVPDGVLDYDPVASTALPVVYPAPPASYDTTGNHPGYILYTPGMDFSIVYPQEVPRSDPFALWPAPDPGEQQLNVNYAEYSLNAASASGTNIWIASLVYNVVGYDPLPTIALTFERGGNILFVNQVEIVPPDISLSAPIELNIIPEPSTAALIGLGVVGLVLTGRRRSTPGSAGRSTTEAPRPRSGRLHS